MPLWTRSVSADVAIDGQIAQTTIVMVFQNENDYNMEADFIYELPQGAVATYFAYWAGDEKVVARVVEKRRAAEIYSHITIMNRDPALIEMVGKNKFRARIFPVFANQDLRVEIKIVQVLPSDVGGMLYTLHLADPKALDPMDNIDVKVRIKQDASISRITNNYGLPVNKDEQDHTVSISGENYRPPKDLNVRIMRTTSPLLVSCYSARSGGSDGFFALALTPDRSLKNPRISIKGASVYEVVPARLPAVKAHQTLAVFGRYKAAGSGALTLTGMSSDGKKSYSGLFKLSAGAIPENPASKLWAAYRIEQLSANKANRNTVVTMSKRYGMPSKFTSWLAVPKEEMVAYNRDKYREKIDSVVERLAGLISEGSGDSASAQALRTELSVLSAKVGTDLREDLKYILSNKMYSLTTEYVHESKKKQPDGVRIKLLQDRMQKVAQEGGFSAEEYIKNAEDSDSYNRRRALAEELANLIADGKGDEPEAKALREELYGVIFGAFNTRHDDQLDPYLSSIAYSAADQLAELIADGKEDTQKGKELADRLSRVAHALEVNVDNIKKDHLKSNLRNLAYELADLKRNKKPNPALLASLKIKIGRLEKSSGLSAQVYFKECEEQHLSDRLWELLYRLGDLIASGKVGTKEEASVRREYNQLSAQLACDPQKRLHDRLEGKLTSLAYELVAEKSKSTPDKSVVANISAQIKRVEQASGISADAFIRDGQADGVWTEIEASADLLKAELAREKPNAPRLTRLRKHLGRLVVSLPKDHYAKEHAAAFDDVIDEAIDSRIEMVQISKQIDAAKSRGDSSKQAELEKRREEVKADFDKHSQDLYFAARWGDPLISVEAPADAQDVIALMPDGEVKPLVYNPDSKKWEARFDIPIYAPEGEYVVTVIVVLNDGTRKVLKLSYRVDITPPTGKPDVSLSSERNRTMRLVIDAGGDVARVAVLLPWGERAEMKSSAQAPNRYFLLVPVPADYINDAAVVDFILTDSAHNRTVLSLEAPVD